MDTILKFLIDNISASVIYLVIVLLLIYIIIIQKKLNVDFEKGNKVLRYVTLYAYAINMALEKKLNGDYRQTRIEYLKELMEGEDFKTIFKNPKKMWEGL